MGELYSDRTDSALPWRDDRFNPLVARQLLNWLRMLVMSIAWLGVDTLQSHGHGGHGAFIYVWAGLTASLTGIGISILALSWLEPRNCPSQVDSCSERAEGMLMGGVALVFSAAMLYVAIMCIVNPQLVH